MKALLINYEYCTGCHACEVACRQEHGLGKGEFGIKLTEVGPYTYEDKADGPGKWEWTWMPVLTKACNMCAHRTAAGKMPACVQTCQAWCMYYGEAEELAQKMSDGSRWALLTSK